MTDAAMDEDTTATSGQDDPEEVAAEAAANQAPQGASSSSGKALAGKVVNKILDNDPQNDPAQASLIAQYGLNAQQARALLKNARDMLAQNAPQLENLAAARTMAPAWTPGGVYAGALGAASDKQQQILGQLLQYDQQGNDADRGALDARLKLMLNRNTDIAKLGSAAMRVAGAPDAVPKTGADPIHTALAGEGVTDFQNDPRVAPAYKAWQDKLTHVAPDPAAQVGAIPTDAKEAYYQQWVATGKMPSVGGRGGPLVQAAYLAYAKQRADADGNSFVSMAANGNLRSANTSALTQGTKQESAISSYYDTMDKNIQNLLDLSGKVDSTGSPLVNKVLRAYQQGVSGDPDVAKYVTYLNSVESEFAKIQSGSMGNQSVTDASRKEAKDTINKFMGPGTIEAVAEGMRGEGQNRLQSIRQQNDYLRNQLGVKNPNAPPTPGETPKPAATPAAKALPSGDKLNAYAQAHFGGDTAKATAFLQQQGYK